LLRNRRNHLICATFSFNLPLYLLRNLRPFFDRKGSLEYCCAAARPKSHLICARSGAESDGSEGSKKAVFLQTFSVRRRSEGKVMARPN
jgi:hypothetical protein